MTNDAPKPNVELLDRTLAEVRRAARRKRNRWDQSVYRTLDCGTAMCFAGWAATLAGRTWADTVDPEVDHNYVLTRPGEGEYWYPRTIGGRTLIDIALAAQLDLGLTVVESHSLFNSDNTLRDLSRIVREIKRRA